MNSFLLDIPWIKSQDATKLIDSAKDMGLHNIKNGWPSHQAVFKGSLDTLNVKVPLDVLKALSGFGGGIANSGGNCGAFCGGIVSLAYLFGNNKPRDFSPIKNLIDNNSFTSLDKIEKSKELYLNHGYMYRNLLLLFENKFGTIYCERLIDRFYPDLISRKRFYYCQKIIYETTGFVVETILEVITKTR